MGVISLVSGHVPTEVSDLTVKDAFDATLESVVDQCPGQDTLLVLGDFNASTGTVGMVMRHVLVPMGMEL